MKKDQLLELKLLKYLRKKGEVVNDLMLTIRPNTISPLNLGPIKLIS